MQVFNPVIISLHPWHAEKILSGEKKLEFRRVWASKPVSHVVIYATVPVKKIVAMATVKQLHKGSPTYLWSIAQKVGGGISRRALYEYLKGKNNAFAIEFDSVKSFQKGLNPTEFINNFRAPQSFAYLPKEKILMLNEMITAEQRSGKIIFVAGIHGVGKSSMCEAFSKEFGVDHKSASQLIKESKAEAISANGKTVKNIENNQELLIQAISNIRKTGKNLLLDGHFSLINAENNLVALQTKVFSDLTIDAVTLIHDDESAIATRLNNRDISEIEENKIKAHQILEINTAKQVSKELSLPCKQIKAFDQSSFNSYLSTIFDAIN
jgi:predicted transcriptional regulator/adenylate kinase